MTTVHLERQYTQVANTVCFDRGWNVLRKRNLEEICDSEFTPTNNRLSVTGVKYHYR